MKYLVDTDICIHWLKGSNSVQRHFEAVGLGDLAISPITVAELYYGAHSSNRVEENLEQSKSFVRHIEMLAMSDVVLDTFGRIKSDLRRHGTLIPDFDLLIASTALANRLVLVTNNSQHYSRISGLKLENWLEA